MAGRHRARAGLVRQALALVVPVVGAAAVATAVVLGSATVSAEPQVGIPNFPHPARGADTVSAASLPFAAHPASDVAGRAVADASDAVSTRVQAEQAAERQRAERAAAERAADAASARAATASAAEKKAAQDRVTDEQGPTRPAVTPRAEPAPPAPKAAPAAPERPRTAQQPSAPTDQGQDDSDDAGGGGLLGGDGLLGTGVLSDSGLGGGGLLGG